MKVTKEKETAATETTTAAGVDNAKALADIQAAKTCAIQSIEESYKFRKIKITQRRVIITKSITKRRTLVTQWTFQLNIKRSAAESTCAAAQKKSANDRNRLENECKRLTGECEELTT